MTTQDQYARYILPVVAQGVEPVVVASAKGRTITDTDGKTYLDCFSGISVVNAGHNHPRILAAARAQMEQLVHCCSYVYQVPVVGQLAEKLAEIVPVGHQPALDGARLADAKSFFSCSGAEANEGAMRLAKQHTGRREIVALAYGFHGRTIGTLSITGNSARKKNNGPYLPGVAFGPAPYCYRCPLGLEYPSCEIACAHALRDTIRQQTSGDVAAFVVEPVLGEGGIVTPPAEYLTIAANIMHEHGALVVVDEVQTGFGRTGKMFHVEHTPDANVDILTMAKGIAAGFPLGAFTARAPVCDAMKPGDHLSTFGGNPIACAAALANIAVIQEERLAENAAARGAELLARCKLLQEKHRLIGDVRGSGLMIGLELVRDRKTKEPAADEAKALRAGLREHGVLVGVGGVFANVVRLQPPLSITTAECDQAAEALEDVLGKLSRS
ncbi:MAG: aspartate aminotransferase family protein [Gemmataceae bacterium]|nr:aspartate aminotransferase family protein [Gemmataceae bacterium]